MSEVSQQEEQQEEIQPVLSRPLTYLACPYSFNGRDDLAKRTHRFDVVTKLAANLMSQGRSVFSPITHGHTMNLAGVEAGWETWAEIDASILATCCREVIVLTLEGWQESRGIQAELALANKLGIPVTYMNEDSKG